MVPSASKQPKTYFIQSDGVETGPFTVSQLNAKRNRNEVSGSDLCRTADSTELHPLGTVFPHMADFVRKSPQEHKQFARKIDGDAMANAALVCGIISFFIATPILSIFAIVLGIGGAARVKNPKALVGAVLGFIALSMAMKTIFR